MSKITLTTLANLQNDTTATNAINSNSTTLTTAMDNTLSRDGTSPNSMSASLDMNSNAILNMTTLSMESHKITNLTAGTANTDAVNLSQLNAVTVAAGNVPTGGATNSILSKVSASNYDTQWTNTGTGILTFLTTPSSVNLLAAMTTSTGTGSLVFGTAPTFTTSIFTPLLIGGTTASSTLTIESTSGAGTTDSIIFKTGSQLTCWTIQTDGWLRGIGSDINGPGILGGTATNAVVVIRATSGAGTISSGMLIQGGTNGATEIARYTTGNIGWYTTGPVSKCAILDQTNNGLAGNLNIGNFNSTGYLVPLSIWTEVANNNGGAAPNATFPVLVLARAGQTAINFNNYALFKIGRQVADGTNSRTQLDIALAHTTPEASPPNILTMYSNGQVSIPASTASTSATTGALVVTGGVGITGKLTVGALAPINPTNQGQFTVDAGSSANVIQASGSASNTTIANYFLGPSLYYEYNGTTANSTLAVDFRVANASHNSFAAIIAQVTDTTNAAVKGALIFATANATAAANEVGRFNPSGGFSVGTITDAGAGNLFINGTAGIGTNATATASLTFKAGTTTVSPISLSSGTNLTTAAAGAVEFDGGNFYFSPAASCRGNVPTEYICRQHAAYTLSSGVAVQKLFNASTNGAVSLPTGAYVFDATIGIVNMSATSGNAALYLVSSTATVTNYLQTVMGIDGLQATAGAATGGSWSLSSAVPSSGVSVETATTSSAMMARWTGSFEVTSSGTIIPSIECLSSSAPAAVQIGSYFRCYRVGSATTTTIGNWS